MPSSSQILKPSTHLRHGMSHYTRLGFGGSRNDKKPTEGGKAPICRLVSRAPKRPSPPLVAGRIDPLGEVKLRRIEKTPSGEYFRICRPDSPHQPKEPACPHLLCPAEPLRSPPDLTLPLSSLLRFNSSHGRIRGLQSPFQSSKCHTSLGEAQGSVLHFGRREG